MLEGINHSRFLRRAFDIAVSFFVLLVFSPILLLVALWIKEVSPGPIFYTQMRIGKDGVPFKLYKFRTMRPDAESGTGVVWAVKSDPRLIKGGKFLKDTHIDEIPQFFNVLKGDMCAVGPRPERPHFVEQFLKTIPGYSERLKVKPGLAGLSQITYDYDKCFEDVQRKIAKDIEYIKHSCLLLDAKILIETFLVVLTRRLRPIKV